jgi:tetratricopeptide (TPR) repeat protein
MDSAHRHELKMNELADWVGHLPDFIRRNYIQIIGAGLIIVGLVVLPVFKRMRRSAAQKQQAEILRLIQKVEQDKVMAVRGGGVDIQNLLLISANSFETAAKNVKNPYSAALALIKQAEALRADLHYKVGRVGQAVVQAQINQARSAYQQAIKKAQGNNTLVAMSKFGLGLCAEELGKFDQAKQIYEEIAANVDFEGTVFPAQAQLRLELMDDNRARFVFVEAPEPQPEETGLTMPEQLAPGTADETIEWFEETTVEPETSEIATETPSETD